jgi:hypothetical protein
VNEWFNNTLRSRLNKQVEGAIIIVMQRLHADDLVAHVQKTENWRVLSFSAIAEDESYEIRTPYRTTRFRRKAGDILQPSLTPRSALDTLRASVTPYHFAAQYQQNPQPPEGYIVKREWLKFYTPDEKPDDFGTILQSWDTAVKDTELANFSVCTTWGLRTGKLICSTFSAKGFHFPISRNPSKARLNHNATVVLIEDMSSGSSLIQQLRAEGLSKVQPRRPWTETRSCDCMARRRDRRRIRSVSEIGRLARYLLKRTAVVSELEL